MQFTWIFVWFFLFRRAAWNLTRMLVCSRTSCSMWSSWWHYSAPISEQFELSARPWSRRVLTPELFVRRSTDPERRLTVFVLFFFFLGGWVCVWYVSPSSWTTNIAVWHETEKDLGPRTGKGLFSLQPQFRPNQTHQRKVQLRQPGAWIEQLIWRHGATCSKNANHNSC